MKITKQQLKQLIEKEAKILLEQAYAETPLKVYANPSAYRKCQNPNVEKDAENIYSALKGIDWLGSGEDVVEDIMAKYTYNDCIRKLYKAFEIVLKNNNDTRDGDLIKWLKDDAWLGGELDTLANRVAMVMKIRL